MSSALVDGGPADDPIMVSAVEFDVLWEQFDLGPMPLALRVPSPGKTHAERAELVRAAWDSLAERGVCLAADPDPRLVRFLRLLSRAEREIDGRLWLGKQSRVLAVASGEDAVLAVLADDQLTISAAEATGLPRYALSALPAAKPGPGHSVTLPSAHFEAAATEATSREAFPELLVEKGVRVEDATTLGEMIDTIVHQGQFGSAGRDKWGRRIRADRVVSFFDTAGGRYVQLRADSIEGEPWTTIAPADHRRMIHHLTELHDESPHP